MPGRCPAIGESHPELEYLILAALLLSARPKGYSSDTASWQWFRGFRLRTRPAQQTRRTPHLNGIDDLPGRRPDPLGSSARVCRLSRLGFVNHLDLLRAVV